MKNRILLAALAALTLFSANAFAESCTGLPQEVKWRFQASASATAGTPFLQALKGMPAGSTDTTQWLAIGGQRIPNVNAKSDSASFGSFIVYIDSSAVYAPGQTTITAVVEGAWLPLTNLPGGTVPQVSEANVQNLGSFTITPTTGAKVIPVPFYSNPASSAIGFQSSAGRSPSFIRLRFSSSAASNAMRCAWVPVTSCPNP